MTGISKEYAEALFMLASENNSVEDYGSALQSVIAVIKEIPEYSDFLSAPGIAKQTRIDAIEEAFADFVPHEVLSFLQLLCESGHFAGLEDCAKEYEQLCRAARNISVAKVISAVALSDSQKQRLNQRLEDLSGHHVTSVYEIDEALIGGLKVMLDGTVLDGSLRHNLHEVKVGIKE